MNIFDIPKTRYISHRGFQPLAPENSLPSFYYAGLFGQWAIETDIHVCRDGEIICCHNDTIDAYCNGTGKISDMTLKELNSFHIIKGNRVECFTEEEKRLPKFSEYLAICRRFGSIPFIELKTDDAEYVVSYMRKNGFSDDEVVISSVDLSRLKASRKAAPNAFLHWIFAKEEQIEELCSLGNAGLSWNIPNSFECPEDKIKLPHDMGLKVCLRAADSVEVFEHMKKLGLDYFPTNKMHGNIERG